MEFDSGNKRQMLKVRITSLVTMFCHHCISLCDFIPSFSRSNLECNESWYWIRVWYSVQLCYFLPFLFFLSSCLPSLDRRLSCSLTREEDSFWREFHSTWVRRNSSSFNEIIPFFIPSFVSTSFSFLFQSSTQTLFSFENWFPFFPFISFRCPVPLPFYWLQMTGKDEM